MCDEEFINLVQYKTPYQINAEDGKPVFRYFPPEGNENPGFPVVPNIPGLTSINAGAHDSGLSKNEITDILNSILPPVEWMDEDCKIWHKEISNSPATRNDVTFLDQNLQMTLKQRQAREKGICPIRRQLFAQVFDELIRQVTIVNAERGLLLLRIRDELRMTLSAHECLFENGFAYGTRKANLIEDGNEEALKTYERVKEEKRSLTYQIQELAIAMDQMGRKQSETKEIQEKGTAEEIQFLKRANQQLRTQLDGIQGNKQK